MFVLCFLSPLTPQICMGICRGQGSPVVDIGIWFPEKLVRPFNVVEKIPFGCGSAAVILSCSGVVRGVAEAVLAWA